MELSGVGEEGTTPGPSGVRRPRAVVNAGADSSRPPGELPRELSSFVGREREISEVKRLLEDTRLLTLTGAGGCGKTRLALAVAQDLVEGFEDGVWWVELALLSDPKLVPGAVASVLGVREARDRSLTEALVEYLKPRKTLLVLDNCEHLVEGCAVLADTLLRACPELEILATSREPLRIAGEVTWLVLGLSLPDPRRWPPTGELARYEAVRLFVERAKAVHAGFALTERNASAVARLCHGLEGIPLAIELAAARVRVLSVEQISEKLEDSLGLLTTGSRAAAARHQTLRATLEWSYELLSEAEQALFRQLSVFAGGWTLEAAETVGAAVPVEAGRVLDLLGRLVDKSLVVAEASPEVEGALRYRMLEPVRQYGWERLQESGEAEQTRKRHAEYYLALAEEAEPELSGARQGVWLERLEAEHGNLRAALSWSLEGGDARLGLRLAGVLGGFWYKRGYLSEGRRWLESQLARSGASPVGERARALAQAGRMALYQGDLEPAIALLEESLSLFKELKDEPGIAASLAKLGHAVLHQDDREYLRALCEEAESLRRSFVDRRATGELLVFLGMVALYEGDLERAVALLEQSLSLFAELGNGQRPNVYPSRGGISVDPDGDTELSTAIEQVAAQAHEYLWLAALEQGDYERAIALLGEELRLLRKLGNRPKISYCLLGLAAVAALQSRPARAARLWVAAKALREDLGLALVFWDHAPTDYEALLAAACAGLDEASWTVAWAEGRDMSPEEAIEYALEEPTTPHEEDPHPPSATKAAVLRIFALGPARVEKDGHPLDSPDWIQKPRELLFYLLTHPKGRTKEQIGLALWPEASTTQLRSSFHDTVYRLRRALGGKEWIAFEKGRYAFDRSLPYFFDVEAFEENFSEARRLQAEAPEQAILHLQEAAELYGGDFLEDSSDSEWVMVHQQELWRAYQEAQLLLGNLLYAQERYAEAAEAYRKAIAHDGFLEEAHRELMRCYAALGERGRAIRHYEELVVLLEEQLGTAPAPETSALYDRLRVGQEEL